MHPSRCKEDFLKRVKANDSFKHEAKLKGGAVPSLPRVCGVLRVMALPGSHYPLALMRRKPSLAAVFWQLRAQVCKLDLVDKLLVGTQR